MSEIQFHRKVSDYKNGIYGLACQLPSLYVTILLPSLCGRMGEATAECDTSTLTPEGLSQVQCSQRGSPSVLSQDEDGRELVVPFR